jgi:hypothetical protein
MPRDDLDEAEANKDFLSKKISLLELDSGLSETELVTSRMADVTSSKSQAPLPPPCSSDVESGFSGDYSPTLLQRQSSVDTNDQPTLERIALELNSIALDWRSYHAPVHCACSLPFDSTQRKVSV